METPPVATSTPKGYALTTHLYALENEFVRLENFDGKGGAIESMSEVLLVVTPNGRFALVFRDGTVEYLGDLVPMNYTELPSNPISENPDFAPHSFRVAYILLKETVGRYVLFVTHHYFAGKCIRFRLSPTTLVREGQRLTVLPDWRAIFDAEPCLEQPDGYQNSGGKMLADGKDHLLVTIGNHTYGQRPIPSNLHIGKFVRIEIETGDAHSGESGHRHSQRTRAGAGCGRQSMGNGSRAARRRRTQPVTGGSRLWLAASLLRHWLRRCISPAGRRRGYRPT